MISMLTWTLKRTLFWIFILLSSTFHTTFCNMEQHESVATKINEVGKPPTFVHEDPEEVREAPISGFDFYSKEDYGEDWWDDDLRFNNEDELHNFPHVQDEKINAATNLKLGDSSKFINSGHIGSNMNYDAGDSTINTGTFSTNRILADTGFQQASPWRTSPLRNMAEKDKDFLGETHSQTPQIKETYIGLHFPEKQWRTMNSALNLNLSPVSTFGNRGKIGSNIEVIRNPIILRSQNLYYPKNLLSYPSNLQSENLNAAANIKAGYEAKLVNEGDIGSNLIYNVAQDKDTNIIHSGSSLPQKQWRTMNSATNLDLGPMSTFGNRGKIGSNIEVKRIPAILRSQSMHYLKAPLSYSSILRPEDMNSAANLNTDEGSRFVNDGEIGSNLIYIAEKGTNTNNVHSGLHFPQQQQLRTMHSAANLDLGPMSIFGNKGTIGSNVEVIRKPAMLRSQSLYYPQKLLSYPSNLQSENLNAAANLNAGYEAKLVNEGDIGSNLIFNVAQNKDTNIIHSGSSLPQTQWRTMNSAANLDLGPMSTFGNRGKIGSNIEVKRIPAILRFQSMHYLKAPLSYSSILRSEDMNSAANLNTGEGSRFVNDGEIGSNLIYVVEKGTNTNNVHSGLHFPQRQLRTMHSAANLDLGPMSIFGNRGKIGSNVEVIQKPAMLRSQSLYYPQKLLSYPSNLQSENLNAAANLKAGYEAKLVNEGDIGSNLIFNVAQDKDTNIIHSGSLLPQKQWRTMNSAANIDLGPMSTFGNRGKIGSNIEVKRIPAILRSQSMHYLKAPLSYSSSLQSEDMNSAANLNTGEGSRFVNDGEIGSNLIYVVEKGTNTNNVHSGLHFPQRQLRTMHSAANLDLGPMSIFGNRGKIGSNVEVIRKPTMLRSQSLYYPQKLLSYPSNLQSENLNAAANLKAGYETKLVNDGEIGSNLIYIVEKGTNTNNVHSGLHFPQRQLRTMHSAANLDLGPMSIFGNRGKIGSNIEVIKEPTKLKSQNLYYPEILLSNHPSFRSEDLNSATNLKTGYGSKIFNEGDIGSNLFYNVAKRTRSLPRINSKTHLPYLHKRTLNSEANLNIRRSSVFGNKGNIGSNLFQKRELGKLKVNSHYHPEITFKYSQRLLPENLNAATNLNIAQGGKFANEGEIGSNILHIMEKSKYTNNMQPEIIFPWQQRKTMNSKANLDLGPLSTFGNGGKIGSNIEFKRKPAVLRSQTIYYPEILEIYHPRLPSENLNAEPNLKGSYGAKFVDGGEITLNKLHIGGRTKYLNKEIPKVYFPQQQWRKTNAAANLNLCPTSTFGNRGKIGANINVIRIPVILRSQNLNYPDLSYSAPLRSENMNAAANLNTDYESKFVNEGEIGSNLIYVTEKDTNTNNVHSALHFPQRQWRTMNSAMNLDLGPMSMFGNRGKIGSNVELIRMPLILRSQSIHYPKILWNYRPRSENFNAGVNLKASNGAKFLNEGEIASNMLLIGMRTKNMDQERPKLYFPQQWGTMNSGANIDLGPTSTFSNRGKIGSNIEVIRKPAILRSQNLYYPDLLLNYPSSLQSDNMHAAANLNTDYGSTFVNEGEVGSNLIYNTARVINDDGVRRNTGAKLVQRFVSNSNQPSSHSLYKSQSSMPNPYVYDVLALRTAENDANKKSNKGKGIVNIFMESGSLFDNQDAIGNEQYEVYSSPFQIKLRTPVTSYAYVIPPSGKGRSALSGGKVVTGISTKTLIKQPNIDINNNYNRNLKHAFNERSSFINDGTISAAEILFSRGSVVASNRSETQTSKSSPGAVSFGKLGLNMANTSNKASIVAGDNAQIFVNGKMGTYQVSIPIGSIVASEGSGVSLRTFNPYWSDLFSETSEPDLKSSLNFFTNLNSVITGVVEVASIGSHGRERVDVCELENPITAVEIGRPLPSNQLLLQLLFVTKLRINLANLLSYLTAISAAKFDESLYVSLQIIYNAIQYRQINVIPLLLLNKHLNLPPNLHFRAMLEILESIAPLNVRYAVKTLIEDFEKHEVKYIGISENLISLLTNTLDLDMIPDIVAELQSDVLFGSVDIFVNQIVEKAFSLITYVKSVTDLKDILYLTMLNLPLSYSIPQLPIKLRLVAQMLFMELTDDAWICAAMRAQCIPSTNVYTDLKNFFRLLLECPKVPANIRAIVSDTVQILPDSMPSNDINELSITGFGPTAAKVIIGDIENDALDTPIEVTNSLGSIIVR